MQLQALAERHFKREIAVLAWDEDRIAKRWRDSAPIILDPLSDAVDFAADNISVCNINALPQGARAGSG